MDLFSPPFQEELMHAETLLWDFSPEPFDPITTIPYPLPPPPLDPPQAMPRSAFVRYVRPGVWPSDNCSSSNPSANGRRNIHHRVIELVRRIPMDRSESKTAENSRGFRHMMRERQRRERLSQSYVDLYSMLPYGSKADKNSIVQSAAAYVRELKGAKDELRRRGEELEARNARESCSERVKVGIRVANPASTLDTMIGALRCLKAMDVKCRAIQTELSGHELTAIMSIETKVGASEVERALMESCG